MAIPAIAAIITAKIANAMSMTQSSGSSSPVENAAKHELRIFAAYVLWLLFVGVVTAAFTVAVWRSNSATQSAREANAKARIKEAEAVGSKANERAERLEQDNIVLRGDLTAESGKVATLQKGASDAKAAQQRVEIDLNKQKEVTARAEKDVAGLKKSAAEQQERAANAERALLELQEKIRPRSLSESQISELKKVLAHMPPSPIAIVWAHDAPDGQSYGEQFARLFSDIGRGVSPDRMASAMFSRHFAGLFICIHDENDKTGAEAGGFLQRALEHVGIDAPGTVDASVPAGSIEIKIGSKE